jgi:hypothetical protein
MLTVGTKTLSINSSTLSCSWPPFELAHPPFYLCFSSDRNAIGWMPENCDREMPKSPQLDLPYEPLKRVAIRQKALTGWLNWTPMSASSTELLLAYER